MKRNNTKVELKKYLSQKEKIKNTFISSCIILVVLTFFIFITYSYFIKDSGEIDVGKTYAAAPNANSEVEIIDKQIVENTSSRQEAIYTIKNSSNTNTYSYYLYQGYNGTFCPDIFYKIPSKEYSHAKGIIKPNEEKKLYIINKSDCDINYLDIKVDSGYEYSPVKISGYEIEFQDNNQGIVDELQEKYGIIVDEIYTNVPDFTKGYPNSIDNNSLNSGLYKTQDAKGDSYYFRGAVTNNYVYFANQYWRILRINGDGTIRLISVYSQLQGDYNENDNIIDYVGYTYFNKNSCTNKNPCVSNYDNFKFTNDENIGTDSTIKNKLEDWYIKNLHDYDNYIALTEYCNDTSYVFEENPFIYFGSYQRQINNKPSLKCPDPIESDGTMKNYGGVYKLKIGLITFDELIMAGFGTTYEPGCNPLDTNYLMYDESNNFYTMSPLDFLNAGDNVNIWPELFGYGNIGSGDSTSVLGNYPIKYSGAYKPVINLKSNTHFIYGDGSYNNPYILE